MPSAVTAFSVKIASLGDAAMELFIALEVICKWNALHALEQKQILLPIYGEAAKESSPSDLLIAFFCTSSGDETSLGTNAEIEKHLNAGRPALIYFSEARADFAGTSAAQEQEWIDLKKRYESRTTVDSYADEKEFRAKLAKHLEATIRADLHFKTDALQKQPPAPAATPAQAAPPVARKLSECAIILLSEACEDFEAYISRIKTPHLLKIQANGKQLVEQGNLQAAAQWESAFQELLTGGFIRDAGCNGQLFQISTKGFEFLKSIGKTPVGYIAELGGM